MEVKNKKIIFVLIIILVLVIISVGFLVYYRYFGSEPEIILPPDKKSSPLTEEQIEAKNEFHEELQKNQDGLEANNKEYLSKPREKYIMARHYELTEEDCEKIIDEDLQKECLSYFNYNQVIRETDLEKCNELAPEWKDMCIYQITTLKFNNWEECNLIADELLSNSCISKYAIATNDPEICANREFGLDSCVGQTKALNNIEEGSIKDCANIKKGEYFMLCIGNRTEDCIELEDDYLIKRCESMRNFGLILASGEKKDCNMLPLEEYKKSCEMFFDNNKEHTDYDEDGVDNGAELFLGTNPLIYEDEASELEDYEKRWNQVFDNIYYQTQTKLASLTVDTDDDGLRDYEEEEIYKTDPKVQDSDGDGFLDGDEVAAGYNPNGEGKL